jgi:hypothetical protein
MRSSKRAAILLALLLAISAAAAYFFWHRASGPWDRRAGELLSFAPADASFIFFVDATAMRASPFMNRLTQFASVRAMDSEYQDFVRETGFDYTRDLDRLMIAGRSGPSGSSAFGVADGRFDREKIARYAQRTGKTEPQSGTDVFLFPAKGSAKSLSVVFLNRNRIAIGDGPSITTLLASLGSSGLSRAMREGVGRVSGSSFFAVSQAGPLPDNLSGIRSDQFSSLARSLRWITLAGRIKTDHLEVALEGECDTTENARQISGTLDGLRILGQMSLSDPKTRQRLQPQAATALETFIKALEISQDGQRVRLIIELRPEILEAASKLGSENPSPAR